MAAKEKRSKTKKRTVFPSARKRPRSKRAFRPSSRIKPDERFEIAYGVLRKGNSQKRAAEIAGISVKRFRAFIRSNKLAKYRDGHWRITDRRQREIAIISEGQQRIIKVRGFNTASLAMRHRAAVQQFLDSNDASLLMPFERVEIKDISKEKHSLETRPNVLLRLANAGSDAEMKIYRLID
jgi:hypothetical protein